MRTNLKAEIILKHDEPLSADDIDNIKYFMQDGIMQIIDSSQNFEIESFKVSPELVNQESQEALFKEV